MAVAQMFKKSKERKEIDLSEKSLGTVKKIAGAGASISYNRKNFKGTSRVSVELTKKNGDFAYLNCSKQLSTALRSGEIKLAQLLGFEVIETQVTNNDPKSPNFNKLETTWFITMPLGGGKVTQTIDDVEIEEFNASTDWLPEDLAVI
jgi:hypothetical protein